MAKISLAPKSEINLLAYEPVMIALSKARAAHHLLEFLTSGHEGGLYRFKTSEVERAEVHVDWIREFAYEALGAALDEVEAESRKLGTNLLAKELAAIPKPKVTSRNRAPGSTRSKGETP